MTFFYAILDVGQRTLVYENARHGPGLLLRARKNPQLEEFGDERPASAAR